MTDHVLVAVQDGVMTLTFNRPDKKNAITDAMYGVLADGLTRARAIERTGTVLQPGYRSDVLVAFERVGPDAAIAGRIGRLEQPVEQPAIAHRARRPAVRL